MEPGAVSSCRPAMAQIVTHDGILSVKIIIIQDKNLWVFRKCEQKTNRVYRGNINVSWKRIICILGSFVWERTIINGNGREIQILANTIKHKGIIE